ASWTTMRVLPPVDKLFASSAAAITARPKTEGTAAPKATRARLSLRKLRRLIMMTPSGEMELRRTEDQIDKTAYLVGRQRCRPAAREIEEHGTGIVRQSVIDGEGQVVVERLLCRPGRIACRRRRCRLPGRVLPLALLFKGAARQRIQKIEPGEHS